MTTATHTAAPEPLRLTLSETITDSRVMAERQLRKILRKPVYLVFAFVQPVVFVLLFRYVFGGAIDTGNVDYVDFLMPGIIVQTAVFGALLTGLGLTEDIKAGVVDRFRSLPIARSAVLLGRTAADAMVNAMTLVVMVLVGMAVGFRPDATRVRARPGVRARARVLLRLLVDQRVHRTDGAGSRDRPIRRVHLGLPADVRLLGVRAGLVDAGRRAGVRRGQSRDTGRRRRAGPDHRSGRRAVTGARHARAGWSRCCIVFVPLALRAFRQA